MNIKKIMRFLKDIAANNNRQWFQEHKAEYDAVKADFEKGVDQVISCLATFDEEVSHLTAKDCTYRFYRDVRISVHMAGKHCVAVIIYIFSRVTVW